MPPALLDVRDVLQAAAGRATDRVAPELWDELAVGLELDDEAAAQVHVRELGRRIAHLSRLTWRRVDAVLARPASATGVRRPALTQLSPGIALSAGEVVLDPTARPARDPLMLLRAAATAAEQDVVLAPATAARLVRECPPLPDPWPSAARHLLVRLLASGRGLLAVWETLEETEALAGILPEWERIRLLPHASEIHRFTVDRHVVETCIEAAGLIRHVARPDVLMVAALLHDIGKGGLTEHSVAGEPLAREIATRMGFDSEAVDLIGTLVRWHLLLADVATTRDPDDPATVEYVAGRVDHGEAMSLLLALTEADARATSPKAWSTWRAGLVRDLGDRVLAHLDPDASTPAPVAGEVAVPEAVRDGGVSVTVEPVGRRRRHGHGDREGPGGHAGRHRRDVRPAAGVGAGRARLATGAVRRVGLGGRRRARRPGRAAATVRGDRRRTGGPDASAAARRLARPGSDRRGPRGRVSSGNSAGGRAADRPGTVHLVCAALARMGLRSGPRTWTPSARRRSTCSTCRRWTRARSRTIGRPTPPTRCARR